MYTHTYTHTMEYYPVIKKTMKSHHLQKHGIWMDLKGIQLSEMSEKDKYHLI